VVDRKEIKGASVEPEVRAVFFDLDGTLLDSEVLYVEAVQIALTRKGRYLSHRKALEMVYGRGWKDIYADVASQFPGSYPNITEMEEVVREIFLELQESRDIRIDGSLELLRRLAGDFPVAVVSGSPRLDVARGIQALGIERDLQFFLGAEDYFPGKPDPICYLTAAARLGVLPETCIVFEDSAAGVVAARAAGMYCVALQRDGKPPQDVSLADQVTNDLGSFDLREFLAAVSLRQPQ
jgi:HAD superfamily hydrolase (TIGR01509 family)